MSKRRMRNDKPSRSDKKACTSFKEEWLSILIETGTSTSSSKKEIVKLSDIFRYDKETGKVHCSFCLEGKSPGEFSTGKSWDSWKLDYLKRHLTQKSHIEAVNKLKNIRKGGVVKLLMETSEEREIKNEKLERSRSDFDLVRILIENVTLAIKINASINSVIDIHQHMEKFIELPKNWRSKNYAFEFVECIRFTLMKNVFNEIKNSTFHTLIVDESIDIFVQKMLTLYFKYHTDNKVTYKTVFGGIVKLNNCDSVSISETIKQFYEDRNLDIQKMVMFTSDGASVMQGRRNGVAAMLKWEIPHLTEQHCVAHREDLGLDDAWKNVSIMQDIENLLRTVYTIFHRSSTKQKHFEELAEVSEWEVLSFKPLNEVRWLSRHFAVGALIKNYDTLIEYCKKQATECNDPICKYCEKTLTNPQYQVAIFALKDVLDELTSLCKYLQKRDLTIIDAHRYVKIKINKLRSQYLGSELFWSDSVKNILSEHPNTDTIAIIRFIERVCLHLDGRFPDDELSDWQAFDNELIVNSEKHFDFGKQNLVQLNTKYSHFLTKKNIEVDKIWNEYSELKFTINEKTKFGLFKTFNSTLTYVHNNPEYSNLSVLYDIMGTFQASSADCERGFSVMNSIKTKYRNRLQEEHLGDLMAIKIHLASEQDIDVNEVYKNWIRMKDRRQKI